MLISVFPDVILKYVKSKCNRNNKLTTKMNTIEAIILFARNQYEKIINKNETNVRDDVMKPVGESLKKSLLTLILRYFFLSWKN